jgi:predicted nucleotide-binding protein (sugar kinase/HSP70/actin superfamily)
MAKRITAQLAARQKGIDVLELMDYECGYDICPHDEYEDVIEGYVRKIIVRRCKKCGRVGGQEKYN